MKNYQPKSFGHRCPCCWMFWLMRLLLNCRTRYDPINCIKGTHPTHIELPLCWGEKKTHESCHEIRNSSSNSSIYRAEVDKERRVLGSGHCIYVYLGVGIEPLSIENGVYRLNLVAPNGWLRCKTTQYYLIKSRPTRNNTKSDDKIELPVEIMLHWSYYYFASGQMNEIEDEAKYTRQWS